MERDVYKKEKIMNIYVGNLPSDATEEALQQAFEAFGKVSSARIIKNKYTGQSRGIGFVEMPERSEGEKAINSLNGKELFGREMDIKEAFSPTLQGRTGRHRTGYGHRSHH